MELNVWGMNTSSIFKLKRVLHFFQIKKYTNWECGLESTGDKGLINCRAELDTHRALTNFLGNMSSFTEHCVV